MTLKITLACLKSFCFSNVVKFGMKKRRSAEVPLRDPLNKSIGKAKRHTKKSLRDCL